MKIDKKKKGFTLIELVVVIAIIGILAAIALPKYNTSKKNAALRAHESNVQMLKTAALVRQSEISGNNVVVWAKGAKSVDGVVSEDHSNYVEKWPNIPNGLVKKHGSEEFNIDDGYTVEISVGEIKVKPDVGDLE